jgi:hypothetical protein
MGVFDCLSFRKGLFLPVLVAYYQDLAVFVLLSVFHLIDDLNSRFLKGLFPSCGQAGLPALPLVCLIEWLLFDRRLTIPNTYSSVNDPQGASNKARLPIPQQRCRGLLWGHTDPAQLVPPSVLHRL